MPGSLGPAVMKEHSCGCGDEVWMYETSEKGQKPLELYDNTCHWVAQHFFIMYYFSH